MHSNSRLLMKRLLEQHAFPGTGRAVIEVGSKGVNRAYRDLVKRSSYKSYLGIDIEDGPNVDVVIPEYGEWNLEAADVVISGQCLEHVRRPWAWIKQVATIVKPGGTVILVAPWIWQIHRHPVDCWRILPDGMDALFDWAGLEQIESGLSEADCYGVARK